MYWFCALPLLLLAELIAIVLAPILPLFAKDGRLPAWLDWFQTPDNSLYGDAGHQARWAGRPLYLQQMMWLMRNRAYGLKLGPFGADPRPYRLYGTADIGNRNSYKRGWFFILNDYGFWYFKCVFPITQSYCLQLAFGWQLDAPMLGRHIYMFSPRITRYYGKRPS